MDADITKLQVFNQLWMSILFLIPLVLISRTVVTGTRYSPILLIVVFGLSMGYILVASGVSEAGLPEFSVINLLSKTTIIALIASFFVGGQELRKVFGKLKVERCDLVIDSKKVATIGTSKTQFIYIARTFFLLLGIETTFQAIVGSGSSDHSKYYPLLAYIGLIGSFILIDYGAVTRKKKHYVIRKGFLETAIILLVLISTFYIANWIKPFIALPQIFYAMLISCTLGAVFYKWSFGPTIRALLFSGLPIVLAANFLIGGSWITKVTGIPGMNSVLFFGFFGQLVWMFGGICLIMFFAKTNNVRNLAPGLAGGLSHAGLTGACTAGDLGSIAQSRTPITINMPFFAHVFVHSIVALSFADGGLLLLPSLIVLGSAIFVTAWSLKTLRKVEVSVNEEHKDSKEIKSLMKFSIGWQLTAMFGSFVLLSVFGMDLDNTIVAATSSLSHFGLFSATQAGTYGTTVQNLMPIIFSMPFLVHPFVFFMFGKAMDRNGEMPKLPAFTLAAIGVIGVIYAIITI